MNLNILHSLICYTTAHSLIYDTSIILRLRLGWGGMLLYCKPIPLASFPGLPRLLIAASDLKAGWGGLGTRLHPLLRAELSHTQKKPG